MTARARELLWEYALRTLAAGEEREVEAELVRSPELRAELAELRELSTALPETLPPIAPAPAVKLRLLESIAARDPFAPFLEKLARIASLTLERARELAKLAADPAAWIPSGLPGLSIIPFEPGAAAPGTRACLVRAVPGFRFPRHLHVGEEVTMVVQGGFHDSIENLAVKPGDIVAHPAGSEHHYVIDPGEDCLGVTVAHGGLELLEKKS